jgi:hypothetical protein
MFLISRGVANGRCRSAIRRTHCSGRDGRYLTNAGLVPTLILGRHVGPPVHTGEVVSTSWHHSRFPILAA